MDKKTRNLIEKINKKLNNKNFYYISKEAERGLGLEKLINNYQVVCKENDHIAQSVSAQVFENARNTTELLTKNPKIKEGDVVQTFYHQITLYSKLVQKKCKVLNPNPSFSKIFEDKIKATKFLESAKVKFPKFKITTLDIDSIKSFPAQKMVIQLPKGHTGVGTLILDKSDNIAEKIKNLKGSLVKISEFIDGIPMTINGCITNNGVFVSGVQYQITGIPEACSNEATTVGNDWGLGYKIYKNHKNEIIRNIQKIGEAMRKIGFYGLFGVDFILNNDVWIIEINARQTANLPMQTKLELQHDTLPLMCLDIAHFLDIDFDYSAPSDLTPLEGSQIFLRAKNDCIVKESLKSGIYRLQSDNSALVWQNNKPVDVKKNIIFLDEEKDMPLVFQNDGYSIDEIQNGGFVILFKPKFSQKTIAEEIARFQFKNSIVQENFKVKPWILKALQKIENYMLDN
ncbi:MAG: hypothetical protein KatS3mg085_558 [Candidatus Dojkabacteria bacterium]|nr:MAG: hypothetical protein KatS3mg085_558 [Candidatus Dojkabacteria bacterium]